MSGFNFETENGNTGTLKKGEKYMINGFCKKSSSSNYNIHVTIPSKYVPGEREFTVLCHQWFDLQFLCCGTSFSTQFTV
jgi:hypothetical protein